MGFSASLPKRGHFVVQSLPITGEHVLACDHDIYFCGTFADRVTDLLQPQFHRAKPCGKRCRHRCDRDSGPFECADSVGYHGRINAHCTDTYTEIRDTHEFEQVSAYRVTRL